VKDLRDQTDMHTPAKPSRALTTRLSAILAAICAAMFLSSCASYVTPGGRADFAAFTDPKIKRAYAARPAIKFPAALALVRVQASGYSSDAGKAHGSGAYSVVTGRDIETEQDVDRLSKLPGIQGVVRLNRLLLPASLASDLDLREAAAKLHADAILLYTMETTFFDRDAFAPLTTISLGLAPTKQYKATATAAALLMDTKTGYIYGALEEAGTRSGLSIAWGSESAMENARKQAERSALDKLLQSFEPFWQRIHARFH
jgi:hypothetical protein